MKDISRITKKILHNQVFLYVSTRYITYAIQFLISFFIAARLGPYYFGIWGFILLLLNYFSLINLGISNSMNVLLVQYKDAETKSNDLIKTSLYLIGGVCLLIVLLTIYYYINGFSYFDKYSLKPIFYIIAIIGIITHYNNLFSVIARVKNDVIRVAFYQSITPVLCFIVIFIGNEKTLIIYLLLAYIIGNTTSLILFITDKKVKLSGCYKKDDATQILKKGFYLFIYNLAFYFIMISTKTIVSFYYTVEEYGFFAFTFTLANSVLLLINAFSFIIFPKLIDKLSSKDSEIIQKNINIIRSNYITLAHGLMYFIIVVYPLILLILPKYSETVTLFHFMCLTMLLNINSFGYGTYLMAQNKEKLLGSFALIALMINLTGVTITVFVIKSSYQMVILSTFIAYFIYSFLVTFFSIKRLSDKLSLKNVLRNFLSIKLFIPLTLSLIIAIFAPQKFWLNIICITLFCFLNFKEIKYIIQTIKTIIDKPNIIDI